MDWHWKYVRARASFIYWKFRVKSFVLGAIFPLRRKRVCHARSPKKLGNQPCFLVLKHRAGWHADKRGFIWRDSGEWAWSGPWEDLPEELRLDPDRNKEYDWIYEHD